MAKLLAKLVPGFWRELGAPGRLPDDKKIVKAVMVVMFLAVATWTGGTALFVRKFVLKPSSHAKVAKAAHGDAHGGGHDAPAADQGGGHSLMGETSPLPDSVRERQDGVEEPGHDLVDPDLEYTRGLVSVLSEELQVDRAYRFVSLPPVMASMKQNDGEGGTFYAEVVLQVSSYDTEKDILKRKQELSGVISSLISQKNRTQLSTFRGVASLKNDIQTEMNHLVSKGAVKDVLFNTYHVK